MKLKQFGRFKLKQFLNCTNKTMKSNKTEISDISKSKITSKGIDK